jgi:hypothetical protein
LHTLKVAERGNIALLEIPLDGIPVLAHLAGLSRIAQCNFLSAIGSQDLKDAQ